MNDRTNFDRDDEGKTVFEKKVISALSVYEEEFRAALASGSSPPKLSVSSFAKRHKISRSVLYERYANLVRTIALAFANLAEEQRQKQASSKSRLPSYTQLKEELARARKEFRRDLSIANSIKMSELLDRCGPAFRDATLLMREKQELQRKIEDLQKQISNQKSIIQNLMAQINSS